MNDTCVCCGAYVPEGRLVCGKCEHLDNFYIRYDELACPECGSPLEIYYSGPHMGAKEVLLIRHCENCLSDWESKWTTKGETELVRKYWG